MHLELNRKAVNNINNHGHLCSQEAAQRPLLVQRHRPTQGDKANKQALRDTQADVCVAGWEDGRAASPTP
jgi:hypothetical protein